MPLYDVRCHFCNEVYETRMSYQEYDECSAGPAYTDICSHCGSRSSHSFTITRMPGVEYAVDGFYAFDNADPNTKYERNYLSRSGDNNDKRLWERRRRRPELSREE